MAHDNFTELVQLGTHPANPQRNGIQPITEDCNALRLPVETICHILRLSDPRDLIRLRVVSKLFRALIDEPALWRTIYATARLPLPPGPFSWQSVPSLQRALVHSARLACTWTADPLTFLSRRTYTGLRSIDDDRFQWVCGRWLIFSGEMRELHARDVETGAERMVWAGGPFAAWGSTSVVVEHGHVIYVAVHLEKGQLSDPVKLLEFVVDDDTGCLSDPEMFDVPTWCLPRESFVPRIRVDGGIAPYAYVSLCAANKPRHSLVFDPRRRRFYKFPRFRTRLDVLVNYRGAWLPHLVEVYFTRTHLLVLSRSYLIHGNLGGVEVVQTFVIPDDDDANPPPIPVPNSNSAPDSEGDKPIVHELCLTHEMLSRDLGSMWLTPIRDSTLDPITQSITLRFMHTYAPPHDTHVRLICMDYVLDSRPPIAASASVGDKNNKTNERNNNPNLNAIVRSAEDVLSITTTSHDVIRLEGIWRGNLVDASHQGFVRGLCMVGRHTSGDRCVSPDELIYKFALDATGPLCVVRLGDPCPPWEDLDPSRNYKYSFDGMRGRIWYIDGDVRERNSAGELVDREVLAIVVDFE